MWSKPCSPWSTCSVLAGMDPAFTLDQFTLFESTLGSEGASYAVVERYPL